MFSSTKVFLISIPSIVHLISELLGRFTRASKSLLVPALIYRYSGKEIAPLTSSTTDT